MTPEGIGAGTIKRLADLRTGGGPTLSVYLDLKMESLSTSAARDAQLRSLKNEPSLAGAQVDIERIREFLGLEADHADWGGACARISTDNELFDRLIDASVRDLYALMMPVGGGALPTAGIFWYGGAVRARLAAGRFSLLEQQGNVRVIMST